MLEGPDAAGRGSEALSADTERLYERFKLNDFTDEVSALAGRVKKESSKVVIRGVLDNEIPLVCEQYGVEVEGKKLIPIKTDTGINFITANDLYGYLADGVKLFMQYPDQKNLVVDLGEIEPSLIQLARAIAEKGINL